MILHHPTLQLRLDPLPQFPGQLCVSCAGGLDFGYFADRLVEGAAFDGVSGGTDGLLVTRFSWVVWVGICGLRGTYEIIKGTLLWCPDAAELAGVYNDAICKSKVVDERGAYNPRHETECK